MCTYICIYVCVNMYVCVCVKVCHHFCTTRKLVIYNGNKNKKLWFFALLQFSALAHTQTDFALYACMCVCVCVCKCKLETGLLVQMRAPFFYFLSLFLLSEQAAFPLTLPLLRSLARSLSLLLNFLCQRCLLSAVVTIALVMRKLQLHLLLLPGNVKWSEIATTTND